MTTEEHLDILDDTPEGAWRVGEVVTALKGGVTANFGLPLVGSRTYRRGQHIAVTADSLRHQQALLDLVADPAAQIRKWGEQRFHRGVLDLEPWTRAGDREWIEARELAREAARHIPDPRERSRALQQVHEKFGPAPTSTATEIRTAHSYQARQAADAEYRREQSGPRHVVRSVSE